MSSTDSLLRGLVGLLLEDRIALDVGALPPLPRAAEPAQPVADVEQERVALLLAVVADVDAGLDLLGTIPCIAALPAALQLVGDRPARRARAARRAGSAQRARQAAGMRGENASFASLHHPPGNASPRRAACLQQGLL